MNRKNQKRVSPEELFDKHGDAKVAYEVDGNYTIAIVKKHRVLEVGIAKRNPTDEYVPVRGQQIALYRALVKLDKKLKKK